jgi:TetR/AcrR family transcriptional regulator, transcriptional repressor for nem operon
MRYSGDHKDKSRAKIVDTAGRAFRLKGFDGIGVDGLMAAADLTSGAFYGHFRSKRAIISEVVAAGLERLRNGVVRTQARSPQGWLRVFADAYLSEAHRRNIAGGCALPSLSGDVVRADAQTRAAYQAGLLETARVMAAQAPFAERPDGPQRALAVLALLAGATLLARAVADEAVGGDIAAAACSAVQALMEEPPPATEV